VPSTNQDGESGCRAQSGGVARGPTPVKWNLIICVLLGVAIFAVYGQALHFGFITFDDDVYVTQNRHVQAGLTAEGFAWAFQTGLSSHWHPLTWLSHMTVCQFFATDPAAHHAANIVLHFLNTVLLFGVLMLMTGRTWLCAFVAALFALHPFHVESVVWVSQRKDVLSMLLGLLSMWAYVAYARTARPAWYAAAFVLLATGLLAKPLLITLPLVFLLLDYWPLGRMRGLCPETAGCPPRSAIFLLIEKVPMLMLSAASTAVTFIMMRGTMPSTDKLPALPMLANMFVSYVRYLAKTFWPTDMALLYPHPSMAGGTPWTSWQVGGSLAVLVFLTMLLLWAGLRYRYLVVGWLWFGITMGPMSLPMGVQAMADRYTYMPLIGLFIIVAWGGADLAARRQGKGAARALAAAAVAVVIGATVTCWFQVRHWRTPAALYTHTINVTGPNHKMHILLGTQLAIKGEGPAAMKHFRRVLAIDKGNAFALTNIGVIFQRNGNNEEAMRYFRRAVKQKPDYAEAHKNLGTVLSAGGRYDEAIAAYHAALNIQDDYAEAHYNLSLDLTLTGRLDEAVEHLGAALHYNRRLLAPLNRMVWDLATSPNAETRDPAKAVRLAECAAEIVGRKDAVTLSTLAAAYAAAGRFDRAIDTAERARAWAVEAGHEKLADGIRRRLAQYRNRQAP